ncbi:MAG TPA: plasmid pRiA4b ORF-3 family protein [Xanthobacteraceae bacterium]|nr:plasmid pRiA4b ORF-3 family protein [Xanthobacteraceae bacterium]
MTEIARLRIELDEVTPAVIRRVEVPVDIRLDDLHFVLQIAIGWQNCHPFEFRVGETAWGLLDRDDPESSPRTAETATLADVLALAKTFRYDYVYGEDWGHTIELEAIEVAAPGVDYPRLVSAQGRCPPADIGGLTGYETFLQAIADPLHLHHEGMIEWDDPDFDPNTVDEAAISGKPCKPRTISGPPQRRAALSYGLRLQD